MAGLEPATGEAALGTGRRLGHPADLERASLAMIPSMRIATPRALSPGDVRIYFAIAVNGVLASVVPHISASRPPSFFMSRNVQVS